MHAFLLRTKPEGVEIDISRAFTRGEVVDLRRLNQTYLPRVFPRLRRLRWPLHLQGSSKSLSAGALGLFAAVGMWTVAAAQRAPENPLPPRENGINVPGLRGLPTPLEMGTLAVLTFGVLVLILQVILLWRAKASAEDVLKNLTVTLVMTLGVCALTLGYNQEQIAPIIGLFGTIIGFLLGQRTRADGRDNSAQNKQDVK